MEIAEKIIEWLLAMGVGWPDVTSVSVGTVSAWSIALILEFMLSGNGYNELKVRKAVVASTVICAWFCSALLWSMWDPIDPLRTVVIVTGVLAPISPISYVVVAKLLSKYVPWINSLWAPEYHTNVKSSEGNSNANPKP